MPPIRTDIVDVYVFRQCGKRRGDVVFLQMRRAADEKDLPGSWQPIMGHIEGEERAAATALRELNEEAGFARADLLGFWQLEQPNTYFLHAYDCIVMSPCFAAEVRSDAEPTLDASHDAHRWVRREVADRLFFWPGQRLAVTQIMRDILEPGSIAEPVLRIEIGS